MPTIKFRCPPGWGGVFPEPQPASKFMPDWIKHLPHDVPNDDRQFPTGTIRRCMPVHDMVTAGYIIPLPVALYAFANEEGESFNWRGDWKLIEQHGDQQAPPYATAFKLLNPWQIITPPGWSTMFLPPAHHLLPFQAHPGIVATDSYKNRINFPFKWLERPYDRVIEAGVPFVQVIPIKRSEWELSVSEATDKQEMEITKAGRRVNTHNHEYKKNHRAGVTE